MEPIAIENDDSEMTESKNERMGLPHWDGDPTGWLDVQQEVRCSREAKNLEVNWSVAARLVGCLKGAARRVGLDRELLPTARDIRDKGERKAEKPSRHRSLDDQARGGAWTRATTEKVVKASRCPTPRTRSREKGERITTTSRDCRRAFKSFQDKRS